MQHSNETLQALILIDLQNDFFPGGALAVSFADRLFPLVNELLDYFPLIIATKDYHPKTHKSFASNHPGKKAFEIIDLNGSPQVLWPDHCVPGTSGSEFHSALASSRIDKIIYKGTDPEIDSYSGFFDNAHQKDTGLDAFLKAQGIKEITILGLATDYCVLYSVLDAIQLGYSTSVVEDACFGINKNPQDVDNAWEKMRKAGAKIIRSKEIKSGTLTRQTKR